MSKDKDKGKGRSKGKGGKTKKGGKLAGSAAAPGVVGDLPQDVLTKLITSAVAAGAGIAVAQAARRMGVDLDRLKGKTSGPKRGKAPPSGKLLAPRPRVSLRASKLRRPSTRRGGPM